MQKLSKTLAIMGLMSPLGASALGTGEIKLYSALNQKLNAELALVLSADESVEDLRVNLAPPAAFAKAGIERPYYLTGLHFEVLSKGRQVPTIKITSAEAIHEPFVNFLVELQWSQGHVLREFTLLLDPPATFKERAVAARGVPQAESLASAGTAHASQDSYSGSEYGPVRSGETLWSIARVVSRERNVSVEQMAAALHDANPQAFANGNINAMLTGSVLRVPGGDAASRRSAAEAKKVAVGEAGVRRAAAAPKAESAAPTPPGEKPLTLLAPDQAGKKGGRASKAELALEIADTAKQENDHLRSRLDDLERQVRLAQRLLTLKDEQIAALQAGKPMPAIPPSLAGELTAQPPEPAPATPSAIPAAAEKPPESAAETTKPVEAAPVPPAVVAPQAGVETAKPVETEAVKTPPPAFAPTPAAEPAAPAVAGQPSVTPTPVAPPATSQPPVQPPAPPPQAVAPAPAPAPQPVAASQESGWFADSFTVGLLGAMGLLIGGIALLAVKRRRAALAELDQELPMQEIRPINLNQAAESRPQESGGAAGLISPSQHGSFLSDFTPSDFDVLDSDNEAIDPISEADVYLAYGRYNQAEELIRQAIAENPFRDECKLKLLEVFFTAQNREAFEKYVAELLEENKNSDQDFWARVVDMGRSLAPENPAFSRGKAEQPAAKPIAAAVTAVSEPVAAAAPAPSAASADDLHEEDFSFDLGGDDPFAQAPAKPADDARVKADEAATAAPASQAEPAMDDTSPSLDFNMFAQAEPEPAPAPAVPHEPAQPVVSAVVAEPASDTQAAKPVEEDEEDPGLSFDLGDFQLAAEAPPVEAPSSPDDSGRTLEFDASSLGGDFSFAGVSSTEASPDAVAGADEGRVLEFAPTSAAAAPAAESDTVSPAPAAAAAATEEPFELDLSTFADIAPSAPAATPAKDDEFNFDMNFDMSVPSFDTVGEEAEAPQGLADLDEVETKLDLAKAYVDMENVDAAKLLLEEVAHQGDERQKREAQDLLASLA